MTATKRTALARAMAVAATVLAGSLAWAAEADRIEAGEAKALFEKGQAVMVDVRGKDAYDMSHVDGALSMPLMELDAHLAQLPKDKMIVTYCTCSAEATSGAAVGKLKQAGFSKVAALKGGLAAWQAAGGKVTALPH